MRTRAFIMAIILLFNTGKVVAQACTVTGPVPLTTTVCVGASVTLSVSASGGETMSYQWYSDADGISGGSTTNLGSDDGAQTADYTPPASTAGTKYYFCKVTGTGSPFCGPTDSDIATLTVAADPSITLQPVSPSAICAGGTTGNMVIAASGGTPSLTYLWQYDNSGSWGAVVNNTP
ncbi:MAG: hypothetical protein V1903_07485, partial [Bacteroidota bacterium]